MITCPNCESRPDQCPICQGNGSLSEVHLIEYQLMGLGTDEPFDHTNEGWAKWLEASEALAKRHGVAPTPARDKAMAVERGSE